MHSLVGTLGTSMLHFARKPRVPHAFAHLWRRTGCTRALWGRHQRRVAPGQLAAVRRLAWPTHGPPRPAAAPTGGRLLAVRHGGLRCVGFRARVSVCALLMLCSMMRQGQEAMAWLRVGRTHRRLAVGRVGSRGQVRPRRSLPPVHPPVLCSITWLTPLCWGKPETANPNPNLALTRL